MTQVFTVKMPDIGEGVVEGEVIEWLKKVSDPVNQDEPVVIVMTDKATVELPSPYAGVLVKQHVAPGQMAVKDKPLYDIEMASVAEEKVEEPAPAPEPAMAASVPSPAISKPAYQKETLQKALAAPTIRKLAHDLDIDIDEVTGTGEEHHVTPSDIKNYLAGSIPKSHEPLAVTEEDEKKPFIGIHYLMAQKMKQSAQEIPHFSFFEKVDVHLLIQLRENLKEKAKGQGIHLTFMPFIIKALSLTLRKYPIVNSSLDLDNKAIIQHKHQHVGIAMATRLGLIVPVLKNVEKMSLEDIIKNYEILKQQASDNKLAPSDMQGSSITISNFGIGGGNGLWATPIINYPEVAILALSKIHKEPVVRNDQIVVREVLNLSWSFDHRLIDGHMAVSISHFFSKLIQNPSSLL